MGKALATRERFELNTQLQERRQPFGDKVGASEGLQAVVFGSTVGHSDLVQEVNETVYKSRRTEALGKGLDRNYQFPDQVKDSRFGFGVPTAGSELTRRPHHGRDLRRERTAGAARRPDPPAAPQKAVFRVRAGRAKDAAVPDARRPQGLSLRQASGGQPGDGPGVHAVRQRRPQRADRVRAENGRGFQEQTARPAGSESHRSVA